MLFRHTLLQSCFIWCEIFVNPYDFALILVTAIMINDTKGLYVCVIALLLLISYRKDTQTTPLKRKRPAEEEDDD